MTKAEKDLTDALGIPVFLVAAEVGWQLRLGEGLVSEKPQVRRIGEIKPVLKNPQADHPELLYWMYRDVRRPEDEHLIFQHSLRYDLTVFNPGVLSVGGTPGDGDEWNKAAGHYHPFTVSGNAFPEVYQVVSGSGLFLLQEVDDPFSVPPVVKRFLIVTVEPGDVLIIPSHCAHPTIVIGDEPLVTVNWVARSFDSQYTPIKLMGGVAYYIVKDGDGWAVEPNPRYRNAPEPERVSCKDLPDKGLSTVGPVYPHFLKEPKAYDFLVHPDEGGSER
ncbi:MAG: hypothetical protein NZ959_06550 [Armatimonadetes bacterium]|nr:hypothetical protein [Armatimonadota bacterium]MDW8121998.1 glucose-6-phosphate isomerase family protein [Armatimonadota bacterium]